MWNPFKPKELPIVDYQPVLSDMNETGIVNLIEQFKGEVEQKKVKFPTELGEEHPFDFKVMEDLYKKFGFYTAVIDKYVDFVWGGGYYVKCDDERALKIIKDFMQDVGFDTLGRKWTKEGLSKGNGILEIGGSKEKGVSGLKNLNSNYIYVERDKKGKIEGYNQYKGAFDKFAKEKVIPFKPEQIAHFAFNVVGDDAYGLGIGYPAMQLIDNLLSMSGDQHFLMKRKANSPLQAKLGKVDGNVKIIPKEKDVQDYGKKMEVMNKKTNWATDDLVELKVVDFGKIGDKFTSILEHDLNMLIYAFQTPGVLLGMSNINMGIAKVEMEAYQRRIQSIQAELEKIIEEKIFKRVLLANGLDVHVEFEWGTPSVMETESRMKLISEMMKAPSISGAMNTMLEDEMANLLKFDTDEWEKLKLEWEAKEEEERKRLEVAAQPVVPGQNAKFPQKVVPKVEQPKQPKAEEMIKEIEDMLVKRDENNKYQTMRQQDLQAQEIQSIKRLIQDREINKDINLKIDNPLVNVGHSEEVVHKLKDEIEKHSEYTNELKNKIEDLEISKKEYTEQSNELKDKLKELEQRQKKKDNEKIDKIKDNEIKTLIKQLTSDVEKINKEKEKKEEELDKMKEEMDKTNDMSEIKQMLAKINDDNRRTEEEIKNKKERKIKKKLRKKKIKNLISQDMNHSNRGLLPSFKISKEIKKEKVKPTSLKVERKHECYEHMKECPHCVGKINNEKIYNGEII